MVGHILIRNPTLRTVLICMTSRVAGLKFNLFASRLLQASRYREAWSADFRAPTIRSLAVVLGVALWTEALGRRKQKVVVSALRLGALVAYSRLGFIKSVVTNVVEKSSKGECPSASARRVSLCGTCALTIPLADQFRRLKHKGGAWC